MTRKEKESLKGNPYTDYIPRKVLHDYVLRIQMIKDNHNEYGEPINYGTIVGILIDGYDLLKKYTGNEK